VFVSEDAGSTCTFFSSIEFDPLLTES
jgi:hypothetical protein